MWRRVGIEESFLFEFLLTVAVANEAGEVLGEQGGEGVWGELGGYQSLQNIQRFRKQTNRKHKDFFELQSRSKRSPPGN